MATTGNDLFYWHTDYQYQTMDNWLWSHTADQFRRHSAISCLNPLSAPHPTFYAPFLFSELQMAPLSFGKAGFEMQKLLLLKRNFLADERRWRRNRLYLINDSTAKNHFECSGYIEILTIRNTGNFLGLSVRKCCSKRPRPEVPEWQLSFSRWLLCSTFSRKRNLAR